MSLPPSTVLAVTPRTGQASPTPWLQQTTLGFRRSTLLVLSTLVGIGYVAWSARQRRMQPTSSSRAPERR